MTFHSCSHFKYDSSQACILCAIISGLEDVKPGLQSLIETNILTEAKGGASLSGRFFYYDGWKSVNLRSLLKSSVFAVSGALLFGETSLEPQFSSSLIRYSRDTELSDNTQQYVPNFLALSLNLIITRNECAKKILLRRLVLAIEQAEQEKLSRFFEILVGGLRIREAGSLAIAEALLSAWLRISYQSLQILIHAIVRICSQLEVEKLRREIGDPRVRTYESLNNLPLLQRVMNESFEKLPVESMKDMKRHEINVPDLADLLHPSDHVEDNGISTATEIKALILLVSKITLAHLLPIFNIQIGPEIASRFKEHDQGLSLHHVRVIIRDRNYVEGDYL